MQNGTQLRLTNLKLHQLFSRLGKSALIIALMIPLANAKSELDIIDNGIVNGLSDNQIIAVVKGSGDLIFKNNFEEISSPTLTYEDQTVYDNGGFVATTLPALISTDVQEGALFSIDSISPTGTIEGFFLIDEGAGTMVFDGDVNAGNVFIVTIKVTNPDGGTAVVMFNLTVVNNL